MIPLSVITFFVTTAVTAFFKYITARAEAKEQAHQRLIEIATKDEESQRKRNSNPNKSFQWTKRCIALMFVGTYLGMKIGTFLGLGALPLVFGTEVTTQFGFWAFGWTETSFQFIPVPGVPLLSYDFHMLSAIIGSYFGSSILSRS